MGDRKDAISIWDNKFNDSQDPTHFHLSFGGDRDGL